MKHQARRCFILLMTVVSMAFFQIPASAHTLAQVRAEQTGAGQELTQEADPAEEAPTQEAELMENSPSEASEETAFSNPVEQIAQMAAQGGVIDRSASENGQTQAGAEGTYSEEDVKTLINQLGELLSDDSTTVGTVTTSGSRLNVRDGGGMDHEVIDHLENGESIEVIGEDHGWYQVNHSDQTGYVSGDYLQVEPGEEITKDELLQRLEAMLLGQTYAPQGQTPEKGNLSMVEEVVDTGGARRQFVTLVSKNGNYFYLVIDRDEKGQNNVYFLNQVDERDLFSLMDEEEAAALKEEMAAEEAARQEAENQQMNPEEESEPENPETTKNMGKMIPFLILLLAALGGGAAFFLLKLKKKPEPEGPDPDADYEEDDSDEMEDYGIEDSGNHEEEDEEYL